MKELSLCCINKDENCYLPEWIAYHRKVGVEHFFIYDHESAVPLAHTLAREIAEGVVSVTRVTGRAQQFPAYRHCLEHFGKQSKWIGFIDMDEFVVPKETRDLRQLLAKFEQFGGLGVNWLIFGSSGLLTRPESQLRSFVKRTENSATDNRHIKSFVQPEHVSSTGPDPHHFIYKKGFFCVNEKNQLVRQAWSPNSTERVQLNHYYLRSEAEWREKMARLVQGGRADGVPPRRWEEFVEMDKIANIVEDREILKLLDQE
jgi:hypothetical protein